VLQCSTAADVNMCLTHTRPTSVLLRRAKTEIYGRHDSQKLQVTGVKQYARKFWLQRCRGLEFNLLHCTDWER